MRLILLPFVSLTRAQLKKIRITRLLWSAMQMRKTFGNKWNKKKRVTNQPDGTKWTRFFGNLPHLKFALSWIARSLFFPNSIHTCSSFILLILFQNSAKMDPSHPLSLCARACKLARHCSLALRVIMLKYLEEGRKRRSKQEISLIHENLTHRWLCKKLTERYGQLS